MASTPKVGRARLCFHILMAYTLLNVAIPLGSILYHGLFERTPFLVDGEPYMRFLSFEWCLTAVYASIITLCAYLLYTGYQTAQLWNRDATTKHQRQRHNNSSNINSTANKTAAAAAPAAGDVYAVPTRVAVACALLFSVSLMYILFFGTIALSERVEEAIGAAPPNLEEMGDRSWAPTTSAAAVSADGNGEKESSVALQPPRTESSASAPSAKGSEATAAAGRGGGGQCGTSGARAGSGANGELTVVDMFWIALESFVDVFAALLDTGEGAGDAESGVNYGGFAMPMSRYGDKVTAAKKPRVSIDYLRRLDLVLLNALGAIISFWGIICFDITVEESQRRRHRVDRRPTRGSLAAQRAAADPNPRGFEEAEEKAYVPEVHSNPQLTLDALSALTAKEGDTAAEAHRDRKGKGTTAQQRNAKAAAHVAQEAVANEINPAAKKNQ